MERRCCSKCWQNGAFSRLKSLSEFGQPGSVFHEHPPKPGYIPGVEAATGSLGHGLPMALGMAIAQRIQGKQKPLLRPVE